MPPLRPVRRQYKSTYSSSVGMPNAVRSLAYSPDEPTPIQIPPELLGKIRDDHLRRYGSRLDRVRRTGDARGVNVGETQRYLNLWTSMGDSPYEKLTPAQRNEVDDAVADGSYDVEMRELGLATRDD